MRGLFSSQIRNRVMFTSLASRTCSQRSYWWKGNSNKADKKDEKKDKKKTKVDSEKEKKPEEFSTEEAKNEVEKASREQKGSLSQFREDLDKFSEALTQSEPIVEIETENMPNSSVRDMFIDMMAPKPVCLTSDMVIPAIPLPVRPIFPGFLLELVVSDPATVRKLREVQKSENRYVGLFLRKEKASNSLADHPDIIRNIDDVYHIGTYGDSHSLIL